MSPRKPPKQINRWAEKAGLHLIPRAHSRYRCRWWHRSQFWVGYGRRWRVDIHGQLQVSDLDFDRWANSLAAGVPLPTTEAAFIAAVRALRRPHTHNDNQEPDAAPPEH